MEAVPRHQCLIYAGSPAKQLPALAALIKTQRKANRRCMYLNSPAMIAGIRSYLAAAGLKVVDEVAEGTLVFSSQQDHFVNGRFDTDRMLGMLSQAVEDALSDGYDGLFATGDMSWEFGKDTNFVELLEYELGLEELFRKHPCLHGVCQYHQEILPIDVIQTGLCTHRGVFVNETLSRVNPHYASPETLARQRPNFSNAQLNGMLSRLRKPGVEA